MMPQTPQESKVDQAIPSCRYYGVKTTGIFCLSGCKSKTPLPENVVCFDTCEDALCAGFRPCKRCRPDLHAYQPNEQLLLQVRDDLDRGFNSPGCLDLLFASIPVSPSHLVRLYKGRFGVTPYEYVRIKRLELAKHLLQTSGMNTADIAANCGFISYTAFFTSFKRVAGVTPGQYQRERAFMKRVFAPGCALLIYKPALAEELQNWLNRNISPMDEHLTCCHHEPCLPEGTQVVNICPGCDRRYRELYSGISTISLWELLQDNDSFPFPDYHGQKMSILDACPTRDQERVHKAVRALLARMNIGVVEPRDTRIHSVCCGDSFYGAIPVEQVKAQMKKRADSMPVEDVVVYCVSCCKSMHIGGKRPRYLVDLLFNEETLPGTFEPDEWHGELDRFIEAH